MVNYRFKYNRKNRLRKDGTALIQLELYTSTRRKFMSTDIYIEPQHWNDSSNRVSERHPRADEFNFRLIDLQNQVESVMRKAVLKEKKLTVDQLIKMMSVGDEILLTKFIEREIENDQSVKSRTKKDFYNTRNKLIEFRPNAKLIDIDFRFVTDWDNYLRTKNLSINTIAKLHKNLKRFINLAINYELIKPEDYPYRNFKVKHEATKRVALSWNELKLIEQLVYDRNSINELIKEMFLFSCYTGLRISDVTRLKTSYLEKVSQGWTLSLTTYKAKKEAFFPLWMLYKTEHKLSKPESIVERYYGDQNQYLFPKISEAKINRQLKVIAADAGIKKNVTFHMGRHVFGTLMASKIPLGTLQQLMQHSDIKTTMVYVNMTKQIIEDDLGKVDWNI